MNRQLLIFIVAVVFVLSAGCTNIIPSRTSNAMPTSTQSSSSLSGAARYSYGDVVIATPNDLIGEVVVGYNQASDSYSSRQIIFDEYGKIYFYEGGRTATINRANFEAQYPYKRATVNDPYSLPNMNKEYSNKYGVGSIVEDPYNPGSGIFIVSYDYPRDVYTYSFATRHGDHWDYDTNVTFQGARTDIEDKYNPDKK
jgi:hypothetical protein